jgi:hypothetical protein
MKQANTRKAAPKRFTNKSKNIRKQEHSSVSQELKLSEAETCVSIPETDEDSSPQVERGGMMEVDLWPKVGLSLWESLLQE